MEQRDVYESLLLELRRGTLVLSVLSQLKAPRYGYDLVQTLQEKGMPIDASTLYPLLRRLESQELLKSEWETSAAKPRKYYVLTGFGQEVFTRLCESWNSLTESMNILMSEGDGEDDNKHK
ncbi:PadR family transcriptional regulator [Acetanaerobacterium elongatum]|uniref:DNA-binding transcriptional regulator, PadR family n=1 Tax=Acetanaerobacterium elongatum TaxID=258515 RepID=A0A1G9ZCJ3_9FIRM|nr:PadR family transcriptional regulator [Acetanaerobacterium elongatum]SDN19108.1 DNA-binding transcriptional regulator, PadR family [Acetanaerobacterium elongatum]